MGAPGGAIYLGKAFGWIARDLKNIAQRMGHVPRGALVRADGSDFSAAALAFIFLVLLLLFFGGMTLLLSFGVWM